MTTDSIRMARIDSILMAREARALFSPGISATDVTFSPVALERFTALVAAAAIAQPIQPAAWRPIDTAPRDGTIVRLLVEFCESSLEDTVDPVQTIGHSNFEHDGEDRWQFAGWCWTHDCYTQGKGVPLGWLPFDAIAQPLQTTCRVSDEEVQEAKREIGLWGNLEATQHVRRALESFIQNRASAQPAEATGLPPLPEPLGAMDVDMGPAGPEYMDGARLSGVEDAYSANQMKAYALAAIAQPEQEPVGYQRLFDAIAASVKAEQNEGAVGISVTAFEKAIKSKIYTSPPQRQPLTHEQRFDLLTAFEEHKHRWHAHAILIDMVEAAHGIGEKT